MPSIKVTVGETAIEVDPDELVMDPKDSVRWESANGREFRIDFGSDSPFTERTLPFSEAIQTRTPKANVEEREYKYSVVSEGGLTLDPTIVIEEQEDGPTKGEIG